MSKWYELKNVKQSAEKEISADVVVSPDSPWFSGHFPGEPILPGIAQLSMICDAVSQAKDQDLKISNMKRVKFKQVIRPGDALKIIVSPHQEKSYTFHIMRKQEVACTGKLSFAADD